jgi:hypothetical protein
MSKTESQAVRHTDHTNKKVAHMPALSFFFDAIFNLGNAKRYKSKGLFDTSRHSEDGIMEIKSSEIISLDEIAKKMNGTTQATFLYLVDQGLAQGYANKITIHMKDFFAARGIKHQKKNVDRLLTDLEILSNIELRAEAICYTPKKRHIEIPKSPLITYRLDREGSKNGKLVKFERRFTD